MQKVLVATGNKGKLREISAILSDWEIVPQSEFDFPEVEETGLSFVENAILKARHASLHSGLPAIADDSGLEVDALRGQPGIYSARYAGAGASDCDNLQKLLVNLQPHRNRVARFRCVVVYMRYQHDPSPVICEGSWQGEITDTPRGDNGFGYDPVFLIPSIGKTAAELAPGEKNCKSHRGKALALLRPAVQQAGMNII